MSSGTMVKRSSGAEFLIFGAKEAFSRLQKAFIKAPILRHFDPKRHIQIETNASGYAIDGVLSQMTLDQHFSDHMTDQANGQTNLSPKISQWYSVAFFSQLMIPAET